MNILWLRRFWGRHSKRAPQKFTPYVYPVPPPTVGDDHIVARMDRARRMIDLPMCQLKKFRCVADLKIQGHADSFPVDFGCPIAVSRDIRRSAVKVEFLMPPFEVRETLSLLSYQMLDDENNLVGRSRRLVPSQLANAGDTFHLTYLTTMAEG